MTNTELERLLNLGKYICCCEQTLIHTKEWYIRACKLRTETDPKLLSQYLDELETIAHAEIKNAKDSIPLLELDSRLGWEPCIEYVGSPDRIAWKEKLIRYLQSDGVLHALDMYTVPKREFIEYFEEKTIVITSNISSSLVIMANHLDDHLFEKIILINPTPLKQLDMIPDDLSKLKKAINISKYTKKKSRRNLQRRYQRASHRSKKKRCF